MLFYTDKHAVLHQKIHQKFVYLNTGGMTGLQAVTHSSFVLKLFSFSSQPPNTKLSHSPDFTLKKYRSNWNT